MAMKQLTVFVENKKGTLVSVTKILSEYNINIRALSVAETQDFGILRLIVDDAMQAMDALEEKNYLQKYVKLLMKLLMDGE